MNIEKVAVVGASGYSGEELVRLLSRHPQVDLVALTSRQVAGQPLSAIPEQALGAIVHAPVAAAVTAADDQRVVLQPL